MSAMNEATSSLPVLDIVEILGGMHNVSPDISVWSQSTCKGNGFETKSLVVVSFGTLHDVESRCCKELVGRRWQKRRTLFRLKLQWSHSCTYN